MNITQYETIGISYGQYLENERLLIAVESDFEYKNFHVLNFKRIERIDKQLKVKKVNCKIETKQNSKIKLLAITEGWCGDAAQILPIIAYFQEKNSNQVSLKIIYRDKNLELMHNFLTNGGMAIPIILICDEKNEVLSYFGPRPKAAQLLMHSLKEQGAEKEIIVLELQKWYNKDKGQSILKEMIDQINLHF